MRKLLIAALGWALANTLAGAEDLSTRLEAYLAATFPAQIEKISVGKEEINISGTTDREASLVSLPIERRHDSPTSQDEVAAIKPGKFTISLPRGNRLTHRWQLVAGGKAISHARYAEEVACRAPDLPPAVLKSKKGLGGWNADRIPGELEALGISSVTVNVKIDSLVALQPESNTVPFQWNGRTWHAREDRLVALDRTFAEAEKNGVMVSAILLVGNPARENSEVVRLLGHPDATKEGIFAMPNVTSSDGISLYGAILNLMAERWSKAGTPHGRVHQWIMHNEVDAGQEWTNAGDKSAIEFMDLYLRSMRMMDLIARQYDPNARVLISLTHHWADPGKKEWYGSKRLLDLLVRFGEAEGDFPWGVAYHPYPQSLLHPRTWEDDQATDHPDTAKITPKNLQVLDVFMKQPRLLHHGNVRPVHLSENGFNSKDYSDAVLAEQAAGMAYAWKKLSGLSSIKAWEYHNWIDNRHEYGLRIGLRKFPDEPGDPLGKKPIWHLYQALGTDREDEACAPYLKTIGIPSWDTIK
jgi:hypothetical protein